MKTIKTVGVKTLKNQLSAYLREVKSGTIVLITDRGRVVAEMREPALDFGTSMINSTMSDWINSGKILSPQNNKSSIMPTSIKLEKGTAQKILDQDRGK